MSHCMILWYKKINATVPRQQVFQEYFINVIKVTIAGM